MAKHSNQSAAAVADAPTTPAPQQRKPLKGDIVLLQVVGRDDRNVPTLCRYHAVDPLEHTRVAMIEKVIDDRGTAHLAVWNGFAWEKQAKAPYDPSKRAVLSWHFREED